MDGPQLSGNERSAVAVFSSAKWWGFPPAKDDDAGLPSSPAAEEGDAPGATKDRPGLPWALGALEPQLPGLLPTPRPRGGCSRAVLRTVVPDIAVLQCVLLRLGAHSLPTIDEIRMQTEHHRQETVSIPLQSLPLRPSTLIALIRKGFATTGDIMDSCQTEMTSTEDGNHDRSGNNGSKNTGENISLRNFANELGCSTSQAADYAHEINESLGSIGLPKVTSENNAKGMNEHKHGGDTNENIMAPRPSILPATAASILRSKGNSRGRQIVSFAQPLDKLLGGGFALTELTEITGEWLVLQFCPSG